MTPALKRVLFGGRLPSPPPPPAGPTTWNPADKNPAVTLSGGNLTATVLSGGFASCRATNARSSGKFGFSFDASFGANILLGIGTGSANLGGYVGSDSAGYGWYSGDGHFLNNGSAVANWANYGALTGTFLMVFDLTAGLAWSYDGTQWNNDPTADPATGVGGASFATGSYFPMFSGNGASLDTATANFSTPSGLPSGFSAWG